MAFEHTTKHGTRYSGNWAKFGPNDPRWHYTPRHPAPAPTPRRLPLPKRQKQRSGGIEFYGPGDPIPFRQRQHLDKLGVPGRVPLVPGRFPGKVVQQLGRRLLLNNPYLGGLDLLSEWAMTDPGRQAEIEKMLKDMGYTRKCDLGNAPPKTLYQTQSFAPDLACSFTAQDVPSGSIDDPAGIPMSYETRDGRRWMVQWFSMGAVTGPGGLRKTRQDQWILPDEKRRLDPKPHVRIYPGPARDPRVQPVPVAVAPSPPVPELQMPPKMPVSYDKKTRRPVTPGGKRLPVEKLLPREKPADTVDTGTGPGGEPPYIGPGIHVDDPPGPGEKEKKRKVPPNLAKKIIAELYDKTTEAKDIVDILYDALGKKCPGAKSMSDKAYCVYANFDSINMEKALYGLAYNHFEDKAMGKFLSYGKKAPYGVQLPGTGLPDAPRL